MTCLAPCAMTQKLDSETPSTGSVGVETRKSVSPGCISTRPSRGSARRIAPASSCRSISDRSFGRATRDDDLLLMRGRLTSIEGLVDLVGEFSKYHRESSYRI